MVKHSLRLEIDKNLKHVDPKLVAKLAE